MVCGETCHRERSGALGLGPRWSMYSLISLRRAFAIQGRVVWALLMREVITRFGRQNIGVLWLLGEPMLFTIGVTALWTIAKMQLNSPLPIVAFAVTGYSSVLMWRNTVSHCSHGIQQNLNLLYHRPVLVIDVFLARITLEVVGATGSFIILSLIFISMGLMNLPSDLLIVLCGWLMLAWFGLALALVVGAGTSYSELISRLWQPISYLLFPLSGAAFMVEWLPDQIRQVVLVLPMVHGVEMLREGFFGGIVRAHYDLGYFAACNAALTLLGMALLCDASRRVEAR
jgi:capsular polysaccharide transport system permease protein